MTARRLPTVLALVLVVASAGCLGGIGLLDDDSSDGDDHDDPPGADELLEHALEAEANVDELHGVQTMAWEDGDETVTATQEVWMRGSDEMRSELIESDEPQAFDVMVANGSTTWMYDEDENRAVVTELAMSPDEAEAFGDELADSFYADMAPSVEGTDTVADREVYVLELTPDGEDAMYEEATLWIDQETYYPLKQESTTSVGVEMSMTVEFESVDFDPGLDDDLFTFDPPEDADVYDASDFTHEQFDDVDQADALAPFDVPEPDVPEGYTLETVMVDENMQGWAVTQRYVDESGAFLTVSVTEADTGAIFEPDGETAEVDGADAVVREVPETGTTTIQWEADGFTYSVSGELAVDDLVDVGESLE